MFCILNVEKTNFKWGKVLIQAINSNKVDYGVLRLRGYNYKRGRVNLIHKWGENLNQSFRDYRYSLVLPLNFY